jgi:hypothetical protein
MDTDFENLNEGSINKKKAQKVINLHNRDSILIIRIHTTTSNVHKFYQRQTRPCISYTSITNRHIKKI